MILQALELTAHDLGLALVAIVFGCVGAVMVFLLLGAILRRADHHHEAEVRRRRAEAEVLRADVERRVRERGRSEMRSYAARPTAGERWGRAA